MAKASEDQYSDAETQKRMDDALRRALNTPPTRHADTKAKKKPSPAKSKAKSTGARRAP